MQRRGELEPDPDERAARVEASLISSSTAARFSSTRGGAGSLELVGARVVEQAGRAADVERCAVGADRSMNAGRSASRNARSRAREPGIVEPPGGADASRAEPASRSFRYSRAQAASPGSTGSSNVDDASRPRRVEVITTTITTRGWSSSTSTCRTVAVSSAGAETSASSRVTCAEHLGRRLQRRLDLAPHEVRSSGNAPAAARAARAARPRRSGSPRSVGMRPAEVCGCVSSPSASSSASSLRTVEGETARPEPLDERLRADGLPVATYSSTTRRRMLALALALQARSFAGDSSRPASEQLGRDAAAEEAAAPSRARASPSRRSGEARAPRDARARPRRAPRRARRCGSGSSSRRPSSTRSRAADVAASSGSSSRSRPLAARERPR